METTLDQPLKLVDASATIPPELQARLEELKPQLRYRGIVQLLTGPGRKPAYRIRFRDAGGDFTVHRSVTIGADPRTAKAVGELIAGWQAEAVAEANHAEEEVQRQREAIKAEQRQRRLIRSTVLMSGMGRKDARAIAADPRKAVEWLLHHTLLGGKAIGQRRSGGRPKKMLLW
jgi:hypothetical protein